LKNIEGINFDFCAYHDARPRALVVSHEFPRSFARTGFVFGLHCIGMAGGLGCATRHKPMGIVCFIG
jgi:hypothetical protein